jgi:endonuclease YncB( thermonuclease family)
MTEYRMKAGPIIDGDTLTCSADEAVRIRLAFIDTPEKGQPPFGELALSYLRSLLLPNEDVLIRALKKDRYHRTIAEVIRMRDGGNVGLRLVTQGLAAVYMCPKRMSAYYAAEAAAKASGLGIWAIAGLHQCPSLWRKSH